jgi:hypothetical protein
MIRKTLKALDEDRNNIPVSYAIDTSSVFEREFSIHWILVTYLFGQLCTKAAEYEHEPQQQSIDIRCLCQINVIFYTL